MKYFEIVLKAPEFVNIFLAELTRHRIIIVTKKSMSIIIEHPNGNLPYELMSMSLNNKKIVQNIYKYEIDEKNYFDDVNIYERNKK